MAVIPIQPIDRPFTAEVTPPGSKSLTNRALVLAALAEGRSELRNVLFADDTRVMLECLGKLGFACDIGEATHTVAVAGRGGIVPAEWAELFCGNSGTTIRFLTALCALGKGTFTLDGIPRMRQRPIGPLLELLRNAGVRCRSLAIEGCPPVEVQADGLAGGLAQYGRDGGASSSQFLSAFLQIAPLARHEVRVDLVGKQTSWPYILMTCRLMDAFGVTPELIRDPKTQEPRQLIIPREPYRATNATIEPDASAASYFLAIAAIHPGSRVAIPGLGSASLQGDVQFAKVLQKMGAYVKLSRDRVEVEGTGELQGIDINLSDMPDMALTLAATALFADGPTILRGLHTLRVKETDRVAALATELSRFGAIVTIEGDDLHIAPPAHPVAAAINTYDDHRMAMSFAIAGTKIPGITIKDAECVRKTYPDFFTDLQRVSRGDAETRRE
ncbi:MAG TPA: 3-phosphoshikimate 1-carboxyvinyltransferase [Tepidisphaeraceae bacterium]|jgi:3-phosphoshikimate 1-carboxyvinyltransferase|nr:3-phosphoshikimate 1-carboxyvinyltransferase [Tepidisphaeraceae bacterium]